MPMTVTADLAKVTVAGLVLLPSSFTYALAGPVRHLWAMAPPLIDMC